MDNKHVKVLKGSRCQILESSNPELIGKWFTTTKAYLCEVINTDQLNFTLRYNDIVFYTPSDKVIEQCYVCHGSKIYQWGGTLNGVPMHTGPCYRCAVKGYITDADRRRNYGYDINIKW